MLVTTSKDLLFIVLAFCALWLTVFLSWLLYYVIAIVRDAESLLGTVRRAATKVDELAHAVQNKFEQSAASFSIAAQAAKEIVMWAIRERAAGKEREETRERAGSRRRK